MSLLMVPKALLAYIRYLLLPNLPPLIFLFSIPATTNILKGHEDVCIHLTKKGQSDRVFVNGGETVVITGQTEQTEFVLFDMQQSM